MTATNLTTVLADHGLIRASGEEAAHFLHQLLTNDITHLGPDQARHAGLCTPKGRLIATFLIWREGPDHLLLLSRDILPAVLKKLSMYVLRSKVKLVDATPERSLLGILGADGVVGFPEASMTTASWCGGTAIRLGPERVILALPADTSRPSLPPEGSLTDWHRAEIRAGVPRITQPTQEAFTPQMVNYELPAIGGVSFQKGCYPGQEIVARTQYLGKVKRRMYRVALAEPAVPGSPVFTPETADQQCGAVVLCAPLPTGGYEALLVTQTTGAGADAIHLGEPDGPRATLCSLPYEVD